MIMSRKRLLQAAGPLRPALSAMRSASSASGAAEGPVYIVFGASGGIGSALARRLAGGGASRPYVAPAALVLSSHDEERLRGALSDLQPGGGRGRGGGGGGGGGGPVISFTPADAADPDAAERVVQKALSDHGHLDGVACCVGSIEARSLLATPLSELDRVLRLNLHAQFNVLKASVKAMLATENQRESAGGSGGGGSVVLLSAALASHGVPNYAAFSAAKSAAEGLMRASAATYAPHNIRVNCVAPGLVATPSTEKFTAEPKVRGASEAMHPSKRLVEASEVAAAVDFLLGGPAAITGQVLAVDCGLSQLHAERVQDYGV